MDREKNINLYLDSLNSTMALPKNFWQGDEGKENFKIITRYIIEVILKLDDNGIKKTYGSYLIKKFKLTRPIYLHFDYNIYDSLNYVYKDRFMPWELRATTKFFFDSEENQRRAIRWLIEEKCGFTKEQAINELQYEHFKENGMAGLFINKLSRSRFKVFDVAYPNEFTREQFETKKSFHWDNVDDVRKAIRELVESNRIDNGDMPPRLVVGDFKSKGLGAMLNRKFKNNTFLALDFAYKNCFDINSFIGYDTNVFKGIEEHHRKAMLKHLFEKKLKWNESDIKTKLNSKVFIDNGLGELLKYYHNSPMVAVKEIYPKFKFY